MAQAYRMTLDGKKSARSYVKTDDGYVVEFWIDSHTHLYRFSATKHPVASQAAALANATPLPFVPVAGTPPHPADVNAAKYTGTPAKVAPATPATPAGVVVPVFSYTGAKGGKVGAPAPAKVAPTPAKVAPAPAPAPAGVVGRVLVPVFSFLTGGKAS